MYKKKKNVAATSWLHWFPVSGYNRVQDLKLQLDSNLIHELLLCILILTTQSQLFCTQDFVTYQNHRPSLCQNLSQKEIRTFFYQNRWLIAPYIQTHIFITADPAKA